MNTENETFEGDALVTQAYRELGVDKAPERLNQDILQMASEEGQQASERGFFVSAWMKPLTWAATIGLSLAIVLEFSELPSVPVPAAAPPAAQALKEEAVPQDTDRNEKVDLLRQATSGEESIQGIIRSDALNVIDRQPEGKSDDAATPAQLSLLPEPDVSEVSELSSAETRFNSPVDAVAEMSDDMSDEMSSDAASKTSAEVSSEVSALVSPRKRAVDIPVDSRAMAAFSVQAEQNESDIAASCEESIRLSRESWLECIENLSESGAVEAADREHRAFILQYPLESRDLEQNK
jgi:hypothetical protein